MAFLQQNFIGWYSVILMANTFVDIFPHLLPCPPIRLSSGETRWTAWAASQLLPQTTSTTEQFSKLNFCCCFSFALHRFCLILLCFTSYLFFCLPVQYFCFSDCKNYFLSIKKKKKLPCLKLIRSFGDRSISPCEKIFPSRFIKKQFVKM